MLYFFSLPPVSAFQLFCRGVLDFIDLSDHKPVTCSLKCPTTSKLMDSILLESFENQPIGFKWQTNDNESKRRFTQVQSTEQISNMLSDIASSNCQNRSYVYCMNKALVDIITKTADRALKRKKTPKKYQSTTRVLPEFYQSTTRVLPLTGAIARSIISAPASIAAKLHATPMPAVSCV